MLDGFLDTFRLTFHDVGLQYSDIVATGAVLTLLCVVVAVVIIPSLIKIGARLTPGWLATFTGSLVYIVVAGALIVVYVLLGWVLDVTAMDDAGPAGAGARLVMIVVLLLGELYLLHALVTRLRGLLADEERAISENDEGVREWFQLLVVGAVAAIVLSLAFAAARNIGQFYAGQVLEGKRVDVSMFGVILPGMQARPVEVVLANGMVAPAKTDLHCVFWLGANDGLAVLFDPGERRLLRYPVESISAVEHIDAQSC